VNRQGSLQNLAFELVMDALIEVLFEPFVLELQNNAGCNYDNP
jgi:hypothetical protein